MQREYRVFLDMLGFNKRFVKDFCKISKPLYGLLNKDVMFNFKDVFECILLAEREINH